MGQSYPKMIQLGPNQDRDVPGRIVAFLRARHPAKTAESVAATTGVSENTVKKWLTRSSVPGGQAMVSLWIAYGPEFLAAVSPRVCGWLSEAVIAERQRRLEAEQTRIEREIAELRR